MIKGPQRDRKSLLNEEGEKDVMQVYWTLISISIYMHAYCTHTHTLLMQIPVRRRRASPVGSVLRSGRVGPRRPAFKGHHSAASVFVLRPQRPRAHHAQRAWRYVTSGRKGRNKRETGPFPTPPLSPQQNCKWPVKCDAPHFTLKKKSQPSF